MIFFTTETDEGQDSSTDSNPRIADVGMRFDKINDLHSFGLSLDSEYLQPDNSDEIFVSTFNNEISGYYYVKF